MADAWGGSWGTSWSASWGDGVAPPVVVTPTVDMHDGGSEEDYRQLRKLLRKRRERIEALQAREEVLEERIEEVREDEPEPERGAKSHTNITGHSPGASLAPLIAELQAIRAEIHRLRTQDDEEAMTMLLVA
jgi:hypothetical protein